MSLMPALGCYDPHPNRVKTDRTVSATSERKAAPKMNSILLV